MASERERLAGLYAEMGDGELERMAGAPEELTDDGRAALQGEMRRRGLSVVVAAQAEERGEVVPGPALVGQEEEREQGFGAGIPGVIPTGAAAVEQALDPGGEVLKGMARLILFYDGIELTRACEVLEEAGVEFAIEEIAGDGVKGVSPHFEVWVAMEDQGLARETLRTKMALFPEAEIVGSAADGNDGVVGVFETRGEAEEVRGMLMAEGFQARLEGMGEEMGFGVVVSPGEQERALGVVANKMGVE